MYVVMNRLQSTQSYASHLEQAFRSAGLMEGVPGFIRFQFLRRTQTSTEADTAEYVALTEWEHRQAYEAWRSSESFGHAHESVHSGPLSAVVECYEVLA